MPAPFSNTQKLLFILLIICSCSNTNKETTDKTIAFIESLDRTLMHCNETFASDNSRTSAVLASRMYSPNSSERLKFWEPKADTVTMYVKKLLKYIDQLKMGLRKEAGHSPDASTNRYNGADFDAPIRFFTTQEKGKELYNKLKQFRNDLLKIDSVMRVEIEDRIYILTDTFSSKENAGEEFTKAVFDHASTQSALIILTTFINNIILAEKLVLDFCTAMTTLFDDGYHFVSFIAKIDSTHVKAGQEIKINAGVGDYWASNSEPQITIDGKKIPITGGGIATYKMKAALAPGIHEVSVKVEYVSRNEKQTVIRNLKYSVVR